MNVSVGVPVAVAATVRVIWLLELIAAMVSPAGMPVPVTLSPTHKPLVDDNPVTDVLPLVVDPLMLALKA